MTKKVIVYCHGYGSTPNTDKVARLRAIPNSEVHAFPIDIDPEISIPSLVGNVDELLLDDMHQDAELVFVGTSLGAWYAYKLSKIYDTRAILINPCYDPYESLQKYMVPEYVREKYGYIIDPDRRCTVVRSLKDDVIDYTNFPMRGWNRLLYIDGSNHRFNGEEFERVIFPLI